MTPENRSAPPPIPDTRPLQPDSLTNRHKRMIFFGITGIIVIILIANAISGTTAAPHAKSAPPTPLQQQNPSLAQIQAKAADLEKQQKELLAETMRGMDQLRATSRKPYPPAPTVEDLQHQAALEQAGLLRDQQSSSRPDNYANNPQGTSAASKSQVEAEKEQQAYKSLFADNVIRQSQDAPVSPAGSSAPTLASPSYSAAPITHPEKESAASTPQSEARKKEPLDFDPGAQPTFWIPEGTIIESVLTDRLDGEDPAPVSCMTTADVYLPGTELLLIPQGSKVIGEARSVAGFGQRRLAVFFHRIMVPVGVRTYAIELDKLTPALSQAGDGGLHDKVNNHYSSIFGASLAIGAIGGLAQIGNGYSGFGYDPSVELRNGVSQSMAQSSSRVLDRFLNRMPTIVIREGTRVKIMLTSDLQVPEYGAVKTGGM